MGKIIKRYQLLQGFSLSTHFEVGGKLINVQFNGGMRVPYLVRGRFSTEVPEMQEAIEASKGFGVQFKLEHTDYEDPKDATNPESSQEETIPEENTPQDTAPEPEESTEVPEEIPDITDHPEIETVSAAKQMLLEMFADLKPGMLPNRVKLLGVAKEKNQRFSKLEI